MALGRKVYDAATASYARRLTRPKGTIEADLVAVNASLQKLRNRTCRQKQPPLVVLQSPKPKPLVEPHHRVIFRIDYYRKRGYLPALLLNPRKSVHDQQSPQSLALISQVCGKAANQCRGQIRISRQSFCQVFWHVPKSNGHCAQRVVSGNSDFRGIVKHVSPCETLITLLAGPLRHIAVQIRNATIECAAEFHVLGIK